MLTRLLSPVTSPWMHHCERTFGSRTTSLIIVPKKPTVVNYLSQHIAFKSSSSLNQLWNNVSILIELLRTRTLLLNRSGKVLPKAILIFKCIKGISFILYQNSYSLGIKLGNLSKVLAGVLQYAAFVMWLFTAWNASKPTHVCSYCRL